MTMAHHDGLPYERTGPEEPRPAGSTSDRTLKAGEEYQLPAWMWDKPPSLEVWRRLHTIETRALHRFHDALTEYGYGAADETGLAGQWADLHRKVRKVKRAMWDGEAEYLTRESLPEILMDLIGHSLLALEMIDRGVGSTRSGSCSSSSPSSPSTSDSTASGTGSITPEEAWKRYNDGH